MINASDLAISFPSSTAKTNTKPNYPLATTVGVIVELALLPIHLLIVFGSDPNSSYTDYHEMVGLPGMLC